MSGDSVSGYGYRHQQCLILFICLTTSFCVRSCIGIALVAMIDTSDEPATQNCTKNNQTTNYNNSESNLSKETESFHSVEISNSNYERENKSETNIGILAALLLEQPYPKFKWSQKIKNVMISSFFWGYVLLQIPLGQISHRFGPRLLLIVAFTVNCIISFCFPWAVYYGGWVLGVSCRILQGLSQACIVPSFFGLFGQWAPLEERSRMVGFAMSGLAFGVVLGIPITGFIALSQLGWPGIFRFYGIASGIVAALVYLLVTDTPALHPKISMAERKYIEDGIGLKKGQTKKNMRVPWRSVLGSRSVYLILFVHMSHAWGHITLFTEIPSFMSRVMQVNIKANGLLTALPFLVMWFTSFFFNWFTDWIIVNKYMKLTNARKLANTLGAVPAAVGLVVLALAPKTVPVVESLLVIICAFKVSMHVGSMVTAVDIAPNFADTIMSISNFCANLIGSQAPIAVSYLVTDERNEKQWRNVFYVAAAMYFFSNLAFCTFGTAERAPWNDPSDEESPEAVFEMEPMIRDEKNENENNPKKIRTTE